MKAENKKEKYSIQKGLTLVELLVAIFVFFVIIGAISGLFISAIRGQSNALASQRLLDQTSYALEYMSRALRMAMKQIPPNAPPCLSQDGLNYEIADIIPGVSGLKFINHLENDDCQGFFLDGGQLKQYKGGTVYELTSSKLEITSLNFSLSGETQGDDLQPKVTVFLEIKGKGQQIAEQPLMKIQTTISQRNLDITY